MNKFIELNTQEISIVSGGFSRAPIQSRAYDFYVGVILGGVAITTCALLSYIAYKIVDTLTQKSPPSIEQKNELLKAEVAQLKNEKADYINCMENAHLTCLSNSE